MHPDDRRDDHFFSIDDRDEPTLHRRLWALLFYATVAGFTVLVFLGLSS